MADLRAPGRRRCSILRSASHQGLPTLTPSTDGSGGEAGGTVGSGTSDRSRLGPPPRLTTVPELLRVRAAATPARTAISVDGTRELTFAEWATRSDGMARTLVDCGIRPGDRVALRFGGADWIAYALAWMAVLKAGGAAVHLSDRMTAAQLTYRSDRAEAIAMIDPAGLRPTARGTCRSVPTDRLHAGRGVPPGVPVGPADVSDIAFTSGTTSGPRAIAVPHGNLTYGRGQAPDIRLFPTESLFLSAWVTGTNASQATLLGALTAGPAVLALSHLDPEHVAGTLARHGVGAVNLPPALAARMARAEVGRRHDLSGVRAVNTGSAPIPPVIRARTAALFPAATVNIMYSSAEASPAYTAVALPPWSEHRDARTYDRQPYAGSVGRPGPGTDVRIAGADGTPQPAGAIGEIMLRSPAPPRRYDRDPDGRAFADGWVRTGDLGHVDEDGHLHIFDRIGDLVVRHGRRISTQAVEAALHRHPGVVEAAVYGCPDPVAGERLTAAVAAEPGVDADEVRAFLDGRLDEPDRPDVVRVVGALPRNLMDKVVKRELRDRRA
ncbi:Acyl-CoA synthetase (AMP-forming)/AMP-acid ligase II [Micromonospora tulbaghiae]|uniref:Acyl-CoA synthetase (AMP-forming)/AMP-acid ligase II n=1 Tax=Micromonospora tulbaghiae TaxID=479978 RepID=A0ABY0KHH1_9ACTN|nr:Acyl-CoA synthetase (AMP-forming)/AMP-acid ligase II [Micromonospora tulbaghiae]